MTFATSKIHRSLPNTFASTLSKHLRCRKIYIPNAPSNLFRFHQAAMITQRGLVWEEGLISWEPKWSEEPDLSIIRTICQRALALSEAECRVEFFTQGGFNKLYKVLSASETYLMRITLPVDPRYKTLSDVATMEFVRRNSEYPVPQIVAHDASARNDLGFEWILMEFVPSQPLYDVWKDISWTSKEKLVKQLVLYAAQLYSVKFEKIGSLYLANDVRHPTTAAQKEDAETISPAEKGVIIEGTTTLEKGTHIKGQLSIDGKVTLEGHSVLEGKFAVEGDFVTNGRLIVDGKLEMQPRGNYGGTEPTKQEDRYVAEVADDHRIQDSTSNFVLDRIVDRHFFWNQNIHQIIHRGPFAQIQDWLTAKLYLSENETKRWMAEEEDEDDLEFGNRVLRVIQRLRDNLNRVFPEIEPLGDTAMVHDDLSTGNILVDEAGNLMAVIDWEFSTAVPVWSAARLPVLLKDNEREERPKEDGYRHDEEGKVDDLYWDHLREYELTALRKLWFAEMESLEPEWIKSYKQHDTKVGFLNAVNSCEMYTLPKVERWLDKLENGEDPGRRPE